MTGLRAPSGAAGSRLLGIGAYRPARVVDNDEVCARLDSDDAWIRRRSGIVTRRFAGPDETVVSMGTAAAVKALAEAGISPADVGLVLLATMSHLEQSPPAAPRIAHGMGAVGAAAMDIGAACAGFCHALALADSAVRSGTARHVVVIGSERMSDLIDPADRSTAFLFGDGAGAVVVGPSDEPGVGPTVWGSDGTGERLIAHEHSWLRARETRSWPVMRMEGPAVFRWATRIVPDAGRRALRAAGVEPAELAAFVPHQANARIVDSAARALGLGAHTAVARDIEHSGNTSAASVPLALEALRSRGAVRPGDTALLVGFGAGLTHAAQVVRLP
ncbi:beta-ketoacyl-ACP synthase III [Streptomyces sp. NPDC056503]|uniref:beta-ketoacyl-ACP synthase III n=1 Tax=Streptomyces sp. NPDC056503 TaxID=3345842 RepID=UPI00367969E0